MTNFFSIGEFALDKKKLGELGREGSLCVYVPYLRLGRESQNFQAEQAVPAVCGQRAQNAWASQKYVGDKIWGMRTKIGTIEQSGKSGTIKERKVRSFEYLQAPVVCATHSFESSCLVQVELVYMGLNHMNHIVYDYLNQTAFLPRILPPFPIRKPSIARVQKQKVPEISSLWQ